MEPSRSELIIPQSHGTAGKAIHAAIQILREPG